MKKFVISLAVLSCFAFMFGGCTKKKKRTVVVEAPNVQVDGNSTSIEEISISLTEILNKLDSLEVRVTVLEGEDCCEDLTTTVSSIESRLTYLETNVGGIVKDGNDLIIEGCNLVVRDGSGETECVPGVGNIIVGRDEAASYAEFYGVDPIRTGSNNLIVGGGQQYTAKGCLMVGLFNSTEADGSATFGCENLTSGKFATVTGGTNNTASGKFSSVSGGCNKTVSSYCGWCAGNYED